MKNIIFSLLFLTALCSHSQNATSIFSVGGQDQTELSASLISSDGHFVYAATYGIWSIIGKTSAQTFNNIWEIEIESDAEVIVRDLAGDQAGNTYALLSFKKSCKLGTVEIRKEGWNEHAVLVKIDKNGNPDNNYLLFENFRPEKLISLPNDDIVLSLVFRHNASFMNKAYEGQLDDVIIASFASNFQNKWVRHISGNGDNSITAMTCDPQGNIYLAGTTVSTLILSGQIYDVLRLSDTRQNGTFLASMKSDGTVTQVTMIPSAGNTIISSMVEKDGVLYTGGLFSYNWEMDYFKAESPSAGNAFIAAFSTNNLKISWFLQGKCEMESMVSDIQLFQNSVYATGSFFKGIGFEQLSEITDEDRDSWRFRKHGFVLKTDLSGKAESLNIIQSPVHSAGQKMASCSNLLFVSGNFSQSMDYGPLSLKATTNFTTGFTIVHSSKGTPSSAQISSSNNDDKPTEKKPVPPVPEPVVNNIPVEETPPPIPEPVNPAEVIQTEKPVSEPVVNVSPTSEIPDIPGEEDPGVEIPTEVEDNPEIWPVYFVYPLTSDDQFFKRLSAYKYLFDTGTQAFRKQDRVISALVPEMENEITEYEVRKWGKLGYKLQIFNSIVPIPFFQYVEGKSFDVGYEMFDYRNVIDSHGDIADEFAVYLNNLGLMSYKITFFHRPAVLGGSKSDNVHLFYERETGTTKKYEFRIVKEKEQNPNIIHGLARNGWFPMCRFEDYWKFPQLYYREIGLDHKLKISYFRMQIDKKSLLSPKKGTNEYQKINYAIHNYLIANPGKKFYGFSTNPENDVEIFVFFYKLID